MDITKEKTKYMTCKIIRSSILLLLLLLFSATASAQGNRQFSVASFELDQFDLTARNEQFKKIDGNGSLFAIIKVTSTAPNDELREYRFDFGNMNHELVYKEGEIWVYVQRNAKFATISRKGFSTIKKYDLGLTIEEGRTYTMKLSPEGKNILLQWVKFEVTPNDAKAIIIGKEDKPQAIETVFGTTDYQGQVAKNLPYGTYSYKVTSENYHPTEGRFTLNDQSKTLIEKIILRPLFSEITLKTGNDADIYVNGESKGKGSWRGRLNAGSYQVECRQDRHKSSFKSINVEEGKPQTIALDAPVPITGTLSLSSTPLDADVTIDGKKTGKKTPFTLPELLIGSHMVMLSKSGYEDKTIDVTIRENERTEEYVQLTAEKKVEKPVITTLTPVTQSRNPRSSTSYTKPKEQTNYKKPRKKIHLGYEYEKGWHFGLSGSYNYSNLNQSEYTKKNTLGYGLAVEYLFDGDMFHGYFQTGLNYLNKGWKLENSAEFGDLDSDMRYFEIPMLIGGHIILGDPYDNIGSIFFDIGPYIAIGQDSYRCLNPDADNTKFETQYDKVFDCGLGLGLGFQLYGFRLRAGVEWGFISRFDWEKDVQKIAKGGAYYSENETIAGRTIFGHFSLTYMFK